ncbi:MAG: hypothetical protein WCB04_07925, partial [Mycobacteriales bacterium]
MTTTTGHRRFRSFTAVLALAIGLEFVAALSGVAYLAAGDGAGGGVTRAIAGRPAPNLGDTSSLTQSERDARAKAVRTLLADRSAALLKRDRAAFLASVDPKSTAFLLRQGQLFDNLRAVPLAEWSYTLNPESELPQSSSRLTRYLAPLWVPQVNVKYRIAGFDDRPTQQRQVLTFVLRSGSWYIGGDDDFDSSETKTARGLWDFGPVVVSRTATTIVLGHPRSLDRLRSLARACDQAIPRVTRVWGSDWSGKLVVLVPDTEAELNRIIQEGSDLSQIAAVATAGLAGSGDGPSGERIIVNPPNFDKLGALGRRVVLQHEVTHVASRAATTGNTPLWLAEGFADYVGYLDSGVPVRSAARELATDLRGGRAPAALPT